MDLQHKIRENLVRVKENIQQAAQSAGREGDQVRLVVVTKGQPLPVVQAAVAEGVKELGENYVEEALPKMTSFQAEAGLNWHMIGHVQSRKARLVAENFDWVHSVDSLKLAKRLDRFAGDMGRKLAILLECNVSGEETKFGWTAWNELEWDDLAKELSAILGMAHLEVRGLMTMAPYFNQPEKARPYFIRLRELRDFLARSFPGQTWDELSMGMSGDYQVAVEEGTTMVRIGTAILGERETRRAG